MKFNYVKSLVLSLGIALLFTGFNSNAFYTQQPGFFCGSFPNCNINTNTNTYRIRNATSQLPFTDEYYLSINCILNNNCSANNTTKVYVRDANSGNYLLQAYNPGEYLYWQYYDSAGYTYDKFNYNFVKIAAEGEGYNYYWWNNLTKQYNYKWILRNGYVNSSLPDERFIYFQPRNGSFIFYNQDYLTGFHTIQFIGNYELVDRFLYVDPAESNDNVYLIDPVSMLAYSTRVDDKDILTDLLFGNYVLNDSFFNNFGWDNWYDLQFGGTSFFPLTYGNFRCDNLNLQGYIGNGCKTSKFSGIGIVYQKKYTDVIQPNYGGGSSSSNSGSTMLDSNLTGYYNCLSDYQRIKSFSDSLSKCRSNYSVLCLPTDTDCYSKSDYDDLVAYMRAFTGTYYDTGFTGRAINFSSCSDVIYPAFVKFYITTPLNSDNTINSDDFEKALLWSVSPDSITSDAYCGSYPSSSSEQSWACQYLGVGCNGFSMGMGYDQVKSIVKPFWDESVGVLINSFDSGFNYFNIPNCSTDYYGKSYGWANTIFIVFVAFIVFQFYLFFKS